MMDGCEAAVLRRADDVTARNRRQAEIAAHQMWIVARQEDDFAAPYLEALSAPILDLDMKLALDDIVIKDQVGRWPKGRAAMLWRDARRHAPRREEVGVQEYAAGQMRHSQDVG